MMIAEESTAWPMVSRPIYAGGLGFDFKWNMGWMHDTLKYFQTDPLFRAGNHNKLTFGLVYAWSENFILPFSHDEVVHMKGSLLNKMPGTTEQKFATLRALYAYMWAHPGKKLLFMGGEFGQWREWNETESLDWHLLDDPLHAGLQRLVRDLNETYQAHNALWEVDHEAAGFEWIDVDNARENIVAFRRRSSMPKGKSKTAKELICVCNFSAVPRPAYRLAVSDETQYKILLSTDGKDYSGTDNLTVTGNVLDLPPLTTVWLEPVQTPKKNKRSTPRRK
jgi:1,4-alpha-glucan branching enzyme